MMRETLAPLRIPPFRLLLAGRDGQRAGQLLRPDRPGLRGPRPDRLGRRPGPGGRRPDPGQRRLPALRRRARRPPAEEPADGRLVRRRGRHPGRGRRAGADRHRHDPAADRAVRGQRHGRRARPAGLVRDRPADWSRRTCASRRTRSAGCSSTAPRSSAPRSAGIVVAAVGPGWGIAVDAVAFLLAAICFGLVKIPAQVRAADAEPVVERRAATIFTDLRVGWSAFISRTWLWVVVAGFCVLNASLERRAVRPRPGRRRRHHRPPGLGLRARRADRRHDHRRDRRDAAPAAPAAASSASSAARSWRCRSSCSASIRTSGCCSPPASSPAWRSSSSASRGRRPCRSTCRRTSWPGCTPTTWSARSSRSRSARSRSGPIAEAIGVEQTMIGAAVLMLLAVAGMVASRDVRHLRHKLPERGPRPMEELPA